MDILTEIIARKREELAAAGRRRSMRRALEAAPMGIIAEFKRRSPSKGDIHADARVEDVIPGYERGGAAALSVLTERAYFGARPEDLPVARRLTDLPILCKDFIISRRQLYEARALGADAALLIAACLPKDECRALAEEAHSLGMEVLLELHDATELDYADIPTEMLGVNNRCLGTFSTDVGHAARMAKELQLRLRDMEPDRRPLLVAESGIRRPEDIAGLLREGYRGFLVGERFMRSARPGEELETFMNQLLRLTHGNEAVDEGMRHDRR